MSKKSKPIPNPYARKILLATRVNSEEMGKVLARSHKNTSGNVSEYVRGRVLCTCACTCASAKGKKNK